MAISYFCSLYAEYQHQQLIHIWDFCQPTSNPIHVDNLQKQFLEEELKNMIFNI